MKNLLIKISIFINYFVFAILLNSVGAVILQLQRNLDISKADVSILEGFKDIPIAVASFFVASFLPKLGLKRGMSIGLLAVTIACFFMPMIQAEFWHFKLLFATTGVAFAIIKIGVFATIGLVTNTEQEHRSIMSWIEGFFMIGVLVGNLLISLFIDDNNPKSTEWLNVYWLLGGLSALAMILLMVSSLDESKAHKEGNALAEDFVDMIKLLAKPLILVFIISAFLFVLIEQSFQTWMPTFYKSVLSVPASMGIQAASILAGAFALGRIAAGFVLKKMKWLPFLLICLALLAGCIIINLPLANAAEISEDISWFNAPLIVYLFPLMGIFLAPIYPTINSVVLTAIPKYLHSSMSGLIVVFSALGGTFGSMITGHLFEAFDGATAFYLALVPIALLATSLFILNRMFIKKPLNES
ncbi:MAG: MFS transporter [Bacteroidetes bacterium]|nr:MAG: MFS transporter [Bacteroidota bacterium]